MPSERTFGNPSSIHGVGRQAKRLMEESRETLAELNGAHPDEMNKVAEAYMAGEDSENLSGAANSILARWRTDRNSADKDTIDAAIEKALAEAEANGIHGKESTPLRTAQELGW